jgi:hypothetical protein
MAMKMDRKIRDALVQLIEKVLPFPLTWSGRQGRGRQEVEIAGRVAAVPAR